MSDSDKDVSTGDLVREAIREGRELIKLEVALARKDLTSELRRARSGAIALGVAAFASIVGFTMILFAIAAATHSEIAVGAVAAVVLFVIAGVTGFAGYRALSERFFQRTRERIDEDRRELGKAHGA